MTQPARFSPFAFMRRWWPALLVGGTALGLLNFFYYWLDDVVRVVETSPGPILLEELTAAYGTALLLPLIIGLAYRWRLDGSAWGRHVPLHLAGVVMYSATKTTWNWAARSVSFPLFGWGSYDYGLMPVRYIMELPSDAILYAVTLPLTYLADRWRRSRLQELELASLSASLAETRLAALRAQLQPHFLFNTLNTISSVMYYDPGAADTMIARLSDLLRRTVDAGSNQEITLAEELELLEIYGELVHARFGERIDITFDVPTDFLDTRVPQLCLQPLFENAVQHGGPELKGSAVIRVAARAEGPDVCIMIEDNGPGFAAEHSGSGGGIGLSNTRDRLAALYGARGRLQIGPRPGGGACVAVIVPAPARREYGASA